MRIVERFFVLGLIVLALGGASRPDTVPATTAGPADRPPGQFTAISIPGRPPLTLYHEDVGDGPPILLLHGLGASTFSWRKIIPALSRHHRVIALDLKGFGRSEKPLDASYSVNDQMIAVRAFVERERLKDITLVGHSFGGEVSLALATDKRFKPRLRRLALLNTPAFPQPVTLALNLLRLPFMPYLALSLIPPETATDWALSTGRRTGPRIEPDEVRGYARPYQDPAARHALIETASELVPANADAIIESYAGLRTPTLIVWCRNDGVVPLATGLRLAKALPNARLKVIEGCGHLPQEFAPDALARLLSEFAGRD